MYHLFTLLLLVSEAACGSSSCRNRDCNLQQQGKDSWSDRVEIRVADIKLNITGEAPAPSGRPVIRVCSKYFSLCQVLGRPEIEQTLT